LSYFDKRYGIFGPSGPDVNPGQHRGAGWHVRKDVVCCVLDNNSL